MAEKLYYDISEVSELTGVKAYVLRYWESEFPQLKPIKTAKGQRKYKKKDIEKVQEIKTLLHEQHFTIAGARKKLSRKETMTEKKPDLIQVLDQVKRELKAISAQLSKPVR